MDFRERKNELKIFVGLFLLSRENVDEALHLSEHVKQRN